MIDSIILRDYCRIEPSANSDGFLDKRRFAICQFVFSVVFTASGVCAAVSHGSASCIKWHKPCMNAVRNAMQCKCTVGAAESRRRLDATPANSLFTAEHGCNANWSYIIYYLHSWQYRPRLGPVYLYVYMLR